MKRIATIGFPVFISMYAIMHYITYLFPTHIGIRILEWAGIAAIVCTFLYLSFRALMVPIFLIVAATVIQLTTGGSFFSFILEGIISMRSLISLLLIVPIIGWILREEPYIDAIMNVAHSFLNTSKKFYFGMMAVNQIIAYFLLFGAIPMMYQFVNAFLGEKRSEAWEYFKGTALLRSFALTTLWVISIPSFVFAVDHLHASLGWTIVQGFVISLAGMFLAILFTSNREKKYQVDITAGIEAEIDKLVQKTKNTRKSNQQVVEFAVLFISLFSSIIILHIVMGWGLLLIIPPMIVLWTFAYFFIKRRVYRLFIQAKAYFQNDMKHNGQQFSLLLSAGMLIYAVNQSGVGNYLVDGLLYVEKVVPFLNFLVILPLAVIVLGFLGLGPLMVIVLVASILEHVSLPYPPELVVLSMTSGSVISVLLSPFILPVIVLSASNNLSMVKNGFSFNIWYAAAFYFIVQLYLQLVWWIVS